jgi:hypothetical protein
LYSTVYAAEARWHNTDMLYFRWGQELAPESIRRGGRCE